MPLEDEINAFVRNLKGRSQLDAASTLSELSSGAVRILPAVEHAGITTSAAGEIRTESATGPIPAELDRIQAECGMGPCVWAATHEEVVRIDDVQCDSRWPDYCRQASDRTPVRSVLSMALVSDTHSRSALNIYAEKPNAFDVGATEKATLYAAFTAMAWAMARRDDQFHQALASRDIIGQAKGMLMERFTIDSQQAFSLLKRLSQSSNTPLAQIAARLVAAETRA